MKKLFFNDPKKFFNFLQIIRCAIGFYNNVYIKKMLEKTWKQGNIFLLIIVRLVYIERRCSASIIDLTIPFNSQKEKLYFKLFYCDFYCIFLLYTFVLTFHNYNENLKVASFSNCILDYTLSKFYIKSFVFIKFILGLFMLFCS